MEICEKKGESLIITLFSFSISSTSSLCLLWQNSLIFSHRACLPLNHCACVSRAFKFLKPPPYQCLGLAFLTSPLPQQRPAAIQCWLWVRRPMNGSINGQPRERGLVWMGVCVSRGGVSNYLIIRQAGNLTRNLSLLYICTIPALSR